MEGRPGVTTSPKNLPSARRDQPEGSGGSPSFNSTGPSPYPSAPTGRLNGRFRPKHTPNESGVHTLHGCGRDAWANPPPPLGGGERTAHKAVLIRGLPRLIRRIRSGGDFRAGYRAWKPDARAPPHIWPRKDTQPRVFMLRFFVIPRFNCRSAPAPRLLSGELSSSSVLRSVTSPLWSFD